MNFFIAKKYKLFTRPQSATPKVRKTAKTANQGKVDSFCSYFYGEDKECQTFLPNKYKSIGRNLLRSGRNSVEQEVASIIQNFTFAKTPEPEEKEPHVEEKRKDFKELIRNARFSMIRKSVQPIQSPISVSKVKLLRKGRISPCNKDFKRLVKDSAYLKVTPKLKKEGRMRKDEVFANPCKFELSVNTKTEKSSGIHN